MVAAIFRLPIKAEGLSLAATKVAINGDSYS